MTRKTASARKRPLPATLLVAIPLFAIFAWLIGVIGLMATRNDAWLILTTAAGILWLISALTIIGLSHKATNGISKGETK